MTKNIIDIITYKDGCNSFKSGKRCRNGSEQQKTKELFSVRLRNQCGVTYVYNLFSVTWSICICYFYLINFFILLLCTKFFFFFVVCEFKQSHPLIKEKPTPKKGGSLYQRLMRTKTEQKGTGVSSEQTTTKYLNKYTQSSRRFRSTLTV